MHHTATRRGLLRLLRLTRPMLQLNLSTLHRVPHCLLPLHPLMLRNDASVRGSELPDRKKSPRYPQYMKCCCCGGSASVFPAIFSGTFSPFFFLGSPAQRPPEACAAGENFGGCYLVAIIFTNRPYPTCRKFTHVVPP